jgi:ATP-binding cassette subfamily F protein 3
VKQGLAREARAGIASSSAGSKPAFGSSATSSSIASKSAKDRRKRKFPYRKSAEIEAEIAEREARVEELHHLFGSEEVLRDGSKVKALKTELDEHEQALPQLYEHWEEASELNG